MGAVDPGAVGDRPGPRHPWGAAICETVATFEGCWGVQRNIVDTIGGGYSPVGVYTVTFTRDGDSYSDSYLNRVRPVGREPMGGVRYGNLWVAVRCGNRWVAEMEAESLWGPRTYGGRKVREPTGGRKVREPMGGRDGGR